MRGLPQEASEICLHLAPSAPCPQVEHHNTRKAISISTKQQRPIALAQKRDQRAGRDLFN